MRETLRRLVLPRIRLLMIALGLLVAMLVISTRLLDEGELIFLTTTDVDGREFETELWIVDLAAGPHLRASAHDAAWLIRLRQHPEIVVERRSSAERYRAFPTEDPGIREQVNRAMADKYGLADDIWTAVSDRSHAVVIRLEHLGEAERSTRSAHRSSH